MLCCSGDKLDGQTAFELSLLAKIGWGYAQGSFLQVPGSTKAEVHKQFFLGLYELGGVGHRCIMTMLQTALFGKQVRDQ